MYGYQSEKCYFVVKDVCSVLFLTVYYSFIYFIVVLYCIYVGWTQSGTTGRETGWLYLKK